MRDLVNGTKELLLAEFQELYPVHGRKWRSLLRKVNAWHSTSTGLEAWKNISNRTTGNEALRLILADMNTVINAQPAETIVRKQALVRSEPQSLSDKYPAAHRAARKRASTKKANS
jgi:hypothetical protein